ncbi:antibiotic biosynthesis monooxygenase [Uliginosibacterium sp. 31-12]|uniref:antibiotic biosynthesis monooxygenase n=1 Tax=Uliginosibacterium sp. 31-12 TaxID=3062781 RepID=UPI0026E45A26|nr:antibiotic biosynthesis monooxygenase [Uliginosibacterium sp. 31-12]MDO6387723.1 antibiotic biosynthesis monooxygenase [Uliginosibacterium sp. 31-12]
MSHASTHPVLLLVSRRAKPGHEAEFERRMEAFIRTAEGYPGCLGAQLVHPGDEEEVEDTLYHALMAFGDADSRNAWQGSTERAAGLASIEPYIEGQVVERGISGLAHWFQPHSGAKPGQPPRWKVAVVTWLGIFPTVYILFRLLGDALASWSLLPRILLLTVLVVVIMTWLVAPQLTRLLKPWLFPTPKKGGQKASDDS